MRDPEARWYPDAWTELCPSPDSTALVEHDDPLPPRRPVGYAPPPERTTP